MKMAYKSKEGFVPVVILLIGLLVVGAAASVVVFSTREKAPVNIPEQQVAEVQQAEVLQPVAESVPTSTAPQPVLKPVASAPAKKNLIPLPEARPVVPPAPRAQLAALEREIGVLASDARPISPDHYVRLTSALRAEAAAGADAQKIRKLEAMLEPLNPEKIPSTASSTPSAPPQEEAPQTQAPPTFQPNCQSNPSPVFTNHITDMSKVNYVGPPPTMGAGPSLKTHSYIGTDHARVPVYAPAAGTLKSGSHYVGGPYMFELAASCEVTVRFGHITEPVEAIRKLLPSEPKQDSRTQELAPVAFAAGELVGYTTGTDVAGNWDFGVYNSGVRNRYADDPHWNNSAAYTTAVCPFDYFTGDLKAAYVVKFNSAALGGNPPHGEPFCR